MKLLAKSIRKLPKLYFSPPVTRTMSEEVTVPDSNQQIQPDSGVKEERPKLKILAFHGYRQNGTVFRAKIGSFRKAVSKYAQLFFISAPHKVWNNEGNSDDGKILKVLIGNPSWNVLLLQGTRLTVILDNLSILVLLY